MYDERHKTGIGKRQKKADALKDIGFFACSAGDNAQTRYSCDMSAPLEPQLAGQLARAQRALSENRLEAAEEGYAQVAAQRPDRAEGFLGLAQVAFKRGDGPEILVNGPRAIRADPTCLPAYEMMAILGMHGGVADTAIEWLEIGAQTLPREPLLFEWLTLLYAIAGRDTDVANCLRHYGMLRGKTPTETALIFARNPALPEDIRSRITSASRIG